ncbi:MAG: hypothetical protein ACTSYN_03850, partial [Candidatus Heimdallarchaeaceae archaeon]
MALTKGFLDTTFPGMHTAQLLYFPILIGLIGMAYAAKQFGQDEIYPWHYSNQIFLLILGGSVAIALGQVLFITETNNPNLGVHTSGIVCLILGHILLAIGFYYLVRKELYNLYLNDRILKEPKAELPIAYVGLTISYVFFLISSLLTDAALIDIFNLVGIGVAIIFSIVSVIGYLRLNILFKAYPL